MLLSYIISTIHFTCYKTISNDESPDGLANLCSRVCSGILTKCSYTKYGMLLDFTINAMSDWWANIYMCQSMVQNLVFLLFSDRNDGKHADGDCRKIQRRHL